MKQISLFIPLIIFFLQLKVQAKIPITKELYPPRSQYRDSEYFLLNSGDISDQKIIRSLSSKANSIRRRALWSVGSKGLYSDEMLRQVRKSLFSENIELRLCAFWAMGQLGGDAAFYTGDLVKSALDQNVDIRRYALWTIGKVATLSPNVLKRLTPLARDRSILVKREFVKLLSGVRWKAALEIALPLLKSIIENSEILVKKEVLNTLESIYSSVIHEKSIAKKNQRIFKQILRIALLDKNQEIRQKAFDLFCRVKLMFDDKEKILISFLADENLEISKKAQNQIYDLSLGRIQEDADFHEKNIGGKSLNKHFRFLFKKLSSRNPKVRLSAVKVFKLIPWVVIYRNWGLKITRALIRLMADEAWYVRLEAHWALANIAEGRIVYLGKNLSFAENKNARKCIEKITKQALPLYFNKLKSEEILNRMLAIGLMDFSFFPVNDRLRTIDSLFDENNLNITFALIKKIKGLEFEKISPGKQNALLGRMIPLLNHSNPYLAQETLKTLTALLPKRSNRDDYEFLETLYDSLVIIYHKLYKKNTDSSANVKEEPAPPAIDTSSEKDDPFEYGNYKENEMPSAKTSAARQEDDSLFYSNPQNIKKIEKDLFRLFAAASPDGLGLKRYMRKVFQKSEEEGQTQIFSMLPLFFRHGNFWKTKSWQTAIIKDIVELLQSPNPIIGRQAFQALVHISSYSPLLVSKYASAMTQVLSRHISVEEGGLKVPVENRNIDQVLFAVQILSNINKALDPAGSGKVLRALKSALNDPDPLLKITILEAFGNFKLDGGVFFPILRKLALDPDSRIQKKAMLAMASLTSYRDKAKFFLIDSLKEKSISTIIALSFLSEFADEILPLLSDIYINEKIFFGQVDKEAEAAFIFGITNLSRNIGIKKLEKYKILEVLKKGLSHEMGSIRIFSSFGLVKILNDEEKIKTYGALFYPLILANTHHENNLLGVLSLKVLKHIKIYQKESILRQGSSRHRPIQAADVLTGPGNTKPWQKIQIDLKNIIRQKNISKSEYSLAANLLKNRDKKIIRQKEFQEIIRDIYLKDDLVFRQFISKIIQRKTFFKFYTQRDIFKIISQSAEDADWFIRMNSLAVINSIYKITSRKDKEYLRKITLSQVVDENWRVRLHAMKIAGDIGPEILEAVPLLISSLRSPRDEIRAESLWALGRMGPVVAALSSAYVEEIFDSMKDSSDEVKIEALYALHSILFSLPRDKNYKAFIKKLLSLIKNPKTRDDASSILTVYLGEDNGLREILEDIRGESWPYFKLWLDNVLKPGEKLEYLYEIFFDESHKQNRLMVLKEIFKDVNLLKNKDLTKTIDVIVEALNDKNDLLRIFILNHLATNKRIYIPKLDPAQIYSSLASENWHVRCWALIALSEFQMEPRIMSKVLSLTTNDKNENVRFASDIIKKALQ